jgi:hypothetical protein
MCVCVCVAEGLHTENALLLSRLGQHDLALAEYVYSLKDFKKAEKYCLDHYDPEREETRDVFFTLLRIYLGHCPPQLMSANSLIHDPSSSTFHAQLHNAALDLLNHYTAQLNPLKVP